MDCVIIHEFLAIILTVILSGCSLVAFLSSPFFFFSVYNTSARDKHFLAEGKHYEARSLEFFEDLCNLLCQGYERFK